MKLQELKPAQKFKAGFIPYFKNGERIEFMFMVPSNSAYGGTAPNIAKGGVDPGEELKTAGIREAEEELGLRQSNLVQTTVRLGWQGHITGLTEDYQMSIFIGQVKSKEAFDDPHFETGEIFWLSAEQFARQGRASQRAIVKHIASSLT